MSPADLRAATFIAFEKFKLDTKIPDDKLTDYDRLLFTLAFTAGVECQTNRIQEMT